ncbi:hypothetical protein C8J56DRAFT_965854, partial [Mycena floridula]
CANRRSHSRYSVLLWDSLVVKRHALLDCLSLLVSSTTGLTITKLFQSKLSRPKLSLVHHDTRSVSPHSVPIATSSNEFREVLIIPRQTDSSVLTRMRIRSSRRSSSQAPSAGPMHC